MDAKATPRGRRQCDWAAHPRPYKHYVTKTVDENTRELLDDAVLHTVILALLYLSPSFQERIRCDKLPQNIRVSKAHNWCNLSPILRVISRHSATSLVLPRSVYVYKQFLESDEAHYVSSLRRDGP